MVVSAKKNQYHAAVGRCHTPATGAGLPRETRPLGGTACATGVNVPDCVRVPLVVANIDIACRVAGAEGTPPLRGNTIYV